MFGHDGRVDSPLLEFYEAAGSFFGNDRRTLNGGRGSAARGTSAGVLAREEGHRRSWIFDHIIEQEKLFESIVGRGRGHDRLPSPQFSVVERPAGYVQIRLAFLFFGPPGDQVLPSRDFNPPPVTPGSVSSASGYGLPRVDGNPGSSATLNVGALSAPSGNSKVVQNRTRHMVVQTDPPPELVFKEPRSVKEEPTVRSSVVTFVVAFALCSNKALVASAGQGPVLSHSGPVEVESVEVCPPSVDHLSRRVSVGLLDNWNYPRECFDEVLEKFYGRFMWSGRPELPHHANLYDKFAGKGSSVDLPEENEDGSFVHGPFRNIKAGVPAVGSTGRGHIGEMLRFQTRTFVYNLGGRVTNTYGSAVRVPHGHHEGNNCFAPGSTFRPPLPSHCRIVYIDIRKLKWCSVDSVTFHSFVWPTIVRKAKSIARTLYANHCNWADVLIVRGRCFRSNRVSLRANRVLKNLLWNWSCMRRPYVVHTEGRGGGGYSFC